MPVLEFVGQSAQDSDNIQANPSRLLNLYREATSGQGGKTEYVLKAVPGSTYLAGLGGVWVRAMAEIGDMLYVLCNGRLYEIEADGKVNNLGAATDSAEGSISGNNGDVVAVIGGNYYHWDGATLTEPTPGAFSSFGSVTYLGNYTILSELNGRTFQWSAVADATDLPGLNFSTADGRDDNILRVMGINGVLYIFKAKSHEIWYLTGQSNASAFERQVGGVVDVGLNGFAQICQFDGGAFFVGDDGRAYLLAGGARPVSTPAVETAIATKSPLACITYDDEGHTFCAIVFDDAPAWVYDVATGEWHERAQGADFGPWQASVSAKAFGVWHIGRDGGEVLVLGRTNTDGGVPLSRRAISRPLYMDGQRFSVQEIEIFPRQGFDAASVMLRLSRDNGHTWTSPKVRSWGVGQYAQRIIWRAQGQARQLVAEITMTDAVECPINATARVKV